MGQSTGRVQDGDVRLRAVTAADIPLLFEHQLDKEANHIAAFTVEDPTDRRAFFDRWQKILADEGIVKRAIVYKGEVVGYIVCFDQFGKRSVGYWLGRSYWGRGIATRALALFLVEVTERPLYARTAHDNVASIRVLEKCGFTMIDSDVGFAHARGEQVEEYVFVLPGGG